MRRILIWAGPILTMVLLVVSGFLYWALATTAGTRWALVTAVSSMGGSASGVSGSVWRGLDIGHLSLPLSSVDINATDLHLKVEWRDLLDRTLHVQDVSARSLDIALTASGEPKPESDAFSMPELPVQVRVDRLALGELSISHDNVAIPVTIGNLSTSFLLDQGQGQLSLSSLDVGHDQLLAHIDGDFRLLGLGEPWPFEAALSARASGPGGDSLLCAQHYLPSLPVRQDGIVVGHEAEAGAPESGDPDNVDTSTVTNDDAHDSVQAASDCTIDISLDLKGSLQDMVARLVADGQDMHLDLAANLTPLAAFPLKDARVDLTLPDDSSLHAKVDWVSESKSAGAADDAGGAHDHISGTLDATRLNVGQLVGAPLPPAILTAGGRFDLRIKDRRELLSAAVDLNLAEGSMWNEQPLQGEVKASVDTDAGIGASPSPMALDWRTLQVHGVDVDVGLGKNHVQASGAFGTADSRLELKVSAPALASFWPGLPGGVTLDGHISGTPAQHALTLDTTYTPENSVPDRLGQAPATVHLDAEGGWRPIAETEETPAGMTTELPPQEGWTGQVLALNATHAGLELGTSGATPLRIVPGSSSADGLWRVGKADLRLALDGRPVLHVDHQGSSGGAAGQWATAGRIDRIVITQALIADVQRVLHLTDSGSSSKESGSDRGGVKVANAPTHLDTQIALALDWDLHFDQALAGRLAVRYLSGDFMVPADPPFPLGLQTLTLDLTATPAGGGVSRVAAELNVATKGMGSLKASADARLHATPGGGFAVNPQDTTTVVLDADIDDLGWVSLFTGDAMQFGGAVNAHVTMSSKRDGSWTSAGTISGADLRIVRIDDGVRLLDGTLAARLQDDRLILDELTFPARLRVEPKEWRTAEWVSTNPEARGGFLRLSGDWRISDMAGDVDIELHRYPIMQRADRYAMVSGDLHIGAHLPALSITGAITADAGWFDLDMLGGIPTVDGDVVVIRAGDEPREVDVPMDISMDIEVDLGPRFYLTGYGVNSGLVGNMRIMMSDNKLTALGALRTRGGAIEAYGQRLQLRRGTITFQGDITSPILDIEALRTGLAVEAGVRVAGTAKRPRIDLVSYPDVSEIEKLSWLLFGHGPDESGGDMALLLTVGTSFLGDGEPFYRKFGIDEVSLQSGELGSAGSILPAESVVSGLSSGTSDLERKFVSVSKGITRGFTVGVRQALSDTGTVGRVSYRLARGLTAELSLGTINGLALVYRWFSRN